MGDKSGNPAKITALMKFIGIFIKLKILIYVK
jgi:hypothetical protein